MSIGAIAGGVTHANPFNLAANVLDDVAVALTHVDDSVVRIEQMVATYGTGSLDDIAMNASKDARVGAYKVNLEAQARLKPHLDTLDATITSRLRNADASLEDANWQLAKKPSPDGRFNGVDLPGSLRDSRAAADILRELVPAIRTPLDDAKAMLADDLRNGTLKAAPADHVAMINTRANAVQLVPRAMVDEVAGAPVARA